MAAVENATCAAELNTAAESAASVEVGLNALGAKASGAKASAASVKIVFFTQAQQAASAGATQGLLSEPPQPGTVQHTTAYCLIVTEDGFSAIGLGLQCSVASRRSGGPT